MIHSSLDERLHDEEDDLLSPNLDVVLNEVCDTSSDGQYSKHNGHINSLSDDEENDDEDDDDDEGDYAPDSDDGSI